MGYNVYGPKEDQPRQNTDGSVTHADGSTTGGGGSSSPVYKPNPESFYYGGGTSQATGRMNFTQNPDGTTTISPETIVVPRSDTEAFRLGQKGEIAGMQTAYNRRAGEALSYAGAGLSNTGYGLQYGADLDKLQAQDARNQSQAARFYEVQGRNQAQEARAAQSDAWLRTLMFAEGGPGPSAAEAQLKMGADANMAQSLALARSGRGAGQNAGALRQAQFSNAAAGQTLNAQLGVQRAQEQQAWKQQQLAAYGQAGQLAGAVREGDFGMRTQDQAMRQGDLALRQQDLGAWQAGTSGALGYQQAGLGYQQAATGREQIGLGYGAQEQGYELARQGVYQGQLNANIQKEAIKSGAYATGLQNQQMDAAREAQERAALFGGVATVGAAALMASDRDAKQHIKPAGVYLAGETGDDKPQTQEDYDKELKRKAGISQATQGVAQMFGAGQQYQAPQFAPVSYQPPYALQPYQPMQVSDRNTKRELDAALEELRMWRSGGAAEMPRTQQPNYPALDAAHARQGQALETVQQAPGFSYQYKDPQAHGRGTFYGPMAQDLEKTPVGKSVVKESPNGTKMVDTSRLSLVNTAALQGQQEQIDSLMAKLDAIGGKQTQQIQSGARDQDFAVPSDKRAKKKARYMADDEAGR